MKAKGVSAPNLQAANMESNRSKISLCAKIRKISESTKKKEQKKEPPYHQQFRLFLLIHNGLCPYCEWLAILCCKDTTFLCNSQIFRKKNMRLCYFFEKRLFFLEKVFIFVPKLT